MRLANAAGAFLIHMRSTTASIGMIREERIRKARAWEHPIIGCEVGIPLETFELQ
jgi:hypothetical protein